MLCSIRHTAVSEVSLGMMSFFRKSSVNVLMVKVCFLANSPCTWRRMAPMAKLSNTRGAAVGVGVPGGVAGGVSVPGGDGSVPR